MESQGGHWEYRADNGQRPLLLIGHGTSDPDGRDALLGFAEALRKRSAGRQVKPCFLEMCGPSIEEAAEQSIQEGADEIVAVPLLLFAARHNKFDIQNVLDRLKARYAGLRVHYGRPLGIAPELLDIARDRIREAEARSIRSIPRADTVVLLVGRGSSDPDANSDVYKMARLLYEGSGFLSVETCYVGITHPRLEEGLRRAVLLGPARVIMLPWLIFTGALLKKIYAIVAGTQARHPEVEFCTAGEIGVDDRLIGLVLRREEEAVRGEVRMNCEMCKFRIIARDHVDGDPHHHSGGDGHSAGHGHDHRHEGGARGRDEHGIAWQDTLRDPDAYHRRAWQVP